MSVPVLALLPVLLAAPRVELEAVVDPDLRTVRGTLFIPEGVTLVPALPLPAPRDDLSLFRTFPGRIERGEQRIEPIGPGRYRFVTRLPRRWGPVGSTRKGLYALGAFHPQPLVDGRVDALAWDVRITLPPGHSGAVGTSIGTETLRWQGESERVTLAVPRRPRLWRDEDAPVTLLTRGAPRRALVRQLTTVLDTLRIHRPLLVVEAPLRRRFARHAPGVLFLSDRSFELPPVLRPLHRPALVEGLLAAHSTASHPQLRDVVGRAGALAWEQRHAAWAAPALAGGLAWLPYVDRLLASRRTLFYAETFRTWVPSDPVRDDVVEQLEPHRPGTALAAQLDLLGGRATLYRIGRALDAGLRLPQAMQLVGLDPRWSALLRAPVPPQDYRLLPGSPLRLWRDAPPDTPPEPIELDVEGERQTLWMDPGETRSLGTPRRVLLDPEYRLLQLSRDADAHPVGRLRLVVAAGLDTLNLSRFRLAGRAAAWVRQRDDTHHILFGSIATDRSRILGLNLSHIYRFGPIRYGVVRRHQLFTSIEPAWFDPRFQSVTDGRFALEGSVGWTWSDRDGSDFPLHGTDLGAGTRAGFHPASDARWWTSWTFASTVVSPHPRHAFTGTTQLALARATRYDRLLVLGGQDQMWALPALPSCTAPGERGCGQRALERWVNRLEYRWVLFRGASIPALIGRGRELRVSVGPELLVARLPEGPAWAVGLHGGLTASYELFGVEPGSIGITAAWLTGAHGLDAPVRPPTPELFLRWGQVF